ncbi:MAG: 30S ribosomal protein S17 [Candidatus Levybacteria bacterium CG_4_10_14_0_2_um_filter_36_16]|nr:MAG: 30S ribosomal protein S17 [Candidatus Levybacteria bacterium CG2_30_37_29]PIR79298.1 MAG: 30S ribosomal protein S17 [Candidatus Levybacteria bacterium CG10_big_fil_rev_8_21_14_0_10_36_30]PIZ97123.1 MAG: 30S ribosomal protein S17 [Candidatus Levybacteria bacterium CG_4_10_14_0_2_um_filter_36_16]PJA90206.1 MAG: 30S ribosomal protein S17 [Candidatus Levybacteria bacterium CG_4_9_14_3_um_filter_36_7]
MAKKQLIGTVLSAKMQNTVVVGIERRIRHKMYKKIITVTKKFKADTNSMAPLEGQMVKIEQTRPMSREKMFKVVEIIKEGQKK